MIFNDALDDFLRYIQYEKRLSPHSILAYKEDIIDWFQYHKATFNDEQVTQVQLFHLRSYMIIMINEMKLKPSSIKRKVSSLNGFFKFLLFQEVIKKNPAKLLQIPKTPERLPSYLNDVQVEKLEQVVEEKDNELDVYSKMLQQLILNLLYQTGMRRSELLQLKYSAIDFVRKDVKVLGKGNKERIIPLSSEMLERIAIFKKFKESEFGIFNENILTLRTGKPVSVSYVYRVVKKHLSDLTTLKKESPHVLRHTFASHLLNNGADLSAIQKLLGHQSLAATQVYTHVNIEKLKDVYRKAHPKSTDE